MSEHFGRATTRPIQVKLTFTEEEHALLLQSCTQMDMNRQDFIRFCIAKQVYRKTPKKGS